jgi:subtilase-type serine protease
MPKWGRIGCYRCGPRLPRSVVGSVHIVKQNKRGGRRSLAAVVVCLAALTLAACNGTGGGGGGGGGPAPDWVNDGVTFDDAVAADYRNSTEFNFVDAFCSYNYCPSEGPPGAPNQANPYALIHLDLALSAKINGVPLNGDGEIVAIVDNGYRLTHQELDGKTVYAYYGTLGAWAEEDHGTAVAALIGGIEDGVGMQGVAPGVALHLSSWQGAGLDHLAAATLDAAGMGAVAQNNSWGYNVAAQQLANYLSGHPFASVAAGLASILGGTTAGWQNYIDAMNTFQTNGVIVWALSNDETMTGGDITAALPYFEESLNEAWIAAVNGYFEVDAGGNVDFAYRLSAPCGYAASFCLAGDGTVMVPTAAGDASYGAGTGTSFVTPQISGAVALLAQAFPDLTPAEIVSRLLVTADNSWFGPLNIQVAGQIDVGGGITHDYSTEWGHGLLDLEAALSPIQTVSILAGEAVSTAVRTPLNEGVVVATAGFGDGLQRALAGREMAVFDALNGNFTVDAGDLVQAPQASSLTSLMRDARAIALLPVTGLGYTNDLAGVIYQTQGLAGMSNASVLSLAADAAVARASADYGRFGLSVFGFAGDDQAYGAMLMSGAGINASLETNAGMFTIGFSQSLEQGALLGLVGNNAFDFGTASSIAAAHVGFTHDFGDRLSVFGNLEVGIAQAIGVGSASLVASVDPAGFNGFNVGATVNGVFTGDDRLTFSVTQPTRINSGAATINLPVGRTLGGDIVTQSVQAGFAPTGRQLDLGLTYAISLAANSQLRLGAQYSIDAGHIDGAKGFAAVLGYGLNF